MRAPLSLFPLLAHKKDCTSVRDLPPELLIAVYAFVDCCTVVWCRSVCRRWRDVIDASLELQYHIELVRDGMTDHRPLRPSALSPPPSDMDDQARAQAEAETTTARLTIGDRLARLRRLRRAWKTLDWTGCVTVPVSGPCCAYELVGGIFCKTQPKARARRAYEVVEWWPGDDDGSGGFPQGHHGQGLGEEEEEGEEQLVYGSRMMSATWLPGTDDRTRSVVRDDLGIPTRDFALDPSQDLMVLFKSGEEAGFPMGPVLPGTLELHVRTISTNEAHPQASVPILCTPVLYPVTSVSVQIVDDVVGVMYCVDPTRPRITIWSWKTGVLVADCSGGQLPLGTWDFSFVNRRALVVTTGNGSGSLELFSFGSSDDADAALDQPTEPVDDADASEPKARSTLTHVTSLRLPPVQPSARVLSVGTHTGPFLAGCPPDKPFCASNEARIHVLTLQYIHLPTLDGPVTRPRLCAFVHNRTLEAFIEDKTRPRVVPWSEWGPTHVRMVNHGSTFQWLRYVHGQRVVMLMPTSEPGKSTLQVLDFNPFSVFDGEDDVDANEGETIVRHVHDPSRIVMPHIFSSPIETGLVYRQARRDVRGDYSGMMIDDERLVGLKYPAFLTGDMKEVDVFTM